VIAHRRADRHDPRSEPGPRATVHGVLVGVLACMAVVAVGCRPRPPAAPGSGSGSPPSAAIGSGSPSGSGSPRHVVLNPPRGVDLSTPATTHKAAREFIRAGDLVRLFRLGFPQDLAQFAFKLHMVIGIGLDKVRATDPALSHRLLTRYAALVAEHGVDYADAEKGGEVLYRRADLPQLLTEMLAFTSSLPLKDGRGNSMTAQLQSSVDEELGPIEYDGDDAWARKGDRRVYFHRVQGCWLLRFAQPPGAGSHGK